MAKRREAGGAFTGGTGGLSCVENVLEAPCLMKYPPITSTYPCLACDAILADHFKVDFLEFISNCENNINGL